MQIITACKQSLGQGNVFTPVCHPVHREVVCIWVVLHPGGLHSRGLPLGEVCLQEVSIQGVCIHGRVLPPRRGLPQGVLHPEGSAFKQRGLPPRGSASKGWAGWADLPPSRNYRIRSTSRRYASCWNAFLLLIIP